MADVQIVWDLENDPDGNYWHIIVEGHGVTQDEVEEVLRNPRNPADVSRTTGRFMTFGPTSTGQYIVVAWDLVSDDPKIIYPVTAYPVPEPRGN